MAVWIYGVSVDRQGRVKGEKPNDLERVVTQGEFFCFRMKHAIVLSVGPMRWYKERQESSKLLIIKKINPSCQFRLCRCDQEWQIDFYFSIRFILWYPSLSLKPELFVNFPVDNPNLSHQATLLWFSPKKNPQEYSHCFCLTFSKSEGT